MVHHDGAVPVDGDEGPGEGSGNGGRVDEAGVGVVAEVERGQVDKVDDQDNFGPGKVRADEEHDEGKVQQVVENEVAANTGSGLNIVGVLREEVSDVANLENEEDDPRRCQLRVGWRPSGTTTHQ